MKNQPLQVATLANDGCISPLAVLVQRINSQAVKSRLSPDRNHSTAVFQRHKVIAVEYPPGRTTATQNGQSDCRPIRQELLVADIAVRCQRQVLLGNCRPTDVSAQPFELLALIRSLRRI